MTRKIFLPVVQHEVKNENESSMKISHAQVNCQDKAIVKLISCLLQISFPNRVLGFQCSPCNRLNQKELQSLEENTVLFFL
jgi:hypothetical protein